MPKDVASALRLLSTIEKATSDKFIKQSAKAALKPMHDSMVRDMPKGKGVHRTYKGRLVAPGFGKRSLKLKQTLAKETPGARLNLAKEAFYMLQFVERGTKPHIMPVEKGKNSTKKFKLPWGGVYSKVNHPGMARKPWFKKNEAKYFRKADKLFAAELVKRIDRAIKKAIF